MCGQLGTRPDLADSVGCLSHFNSNPGATHVAALKHVLRYLAGTTVYQLVYGTPSTTASHASSSNQAVRGGLGVQRLQGELPAGSHRNRRLWRCPPSKRVLAACAASKEGVWQRAILAQAGVSTNSPMLILTDNQGAMPLTKNPNHHQRSSTSMSAITMYVDRWRSMSFNSTTSPPLTKPPISSPSHSEKCNSTAVWLRWTFDQPPHLPTLRSSSTLCSRRGSVGM